MREKLLLVEEMELERLRTRLFMAETAGSVLAPPLNIGELTNALCRRYINLARTDTVAALSSDEAVTLALLRGILDQGQALTVIELAALERLERRDAVDSAIAASERSRP